MFSPSSAKTLTAANQLPGNSEKLMRGAIRAKSGSFKTREGDEGLSIAIPVQLCGTDLNGQDFVENTRTEHVSVHGARVVLNRFLGPDQQIVIRRAGSRQESIARVVGQIGIRPYGYVYGVELAAGHANFWGVHFPPGSMTTTATVIRCTCCLTWQKTQLNEVEVAVLQANGILSWACDECCAITFWQVSPEEQSCDSNRQARDLKSTKSNRRKNVRTGMKASACLCQPTGLRDVARVIDVSRGGISFRTSQNYPIYSWVELAAPYTEGGANIFVPGRIVWERPASSGLREYGVQYVRN
jgi:hypothetical protein